VRTTEGSRYVKRAMFLVEGERTFLVVVAAMIATRGKESLRFGLTAFLSVVAGGRHEEILRLPMLEKTRSHLRFVHASISFLGIEPHDRMGLTLYLVRASWHQSGNDGD
jgi:hypothetical protein